MSKQFLKNYILLLSYSLSDGQLNDENSIFNRRLDKVDQYKNNGFYNTLVHLTHEVFNFEEKFTSVENHRKHTVLDNIFPYAARMGIEAIVGLNLKQNYWINWMEDIKVELASIYMIKVTDRLMDQIGIIMRNGNIYRKITKSNYFFKSLVLSAKNQEIFKKIFYILTIPFRQKLIYMVGAPGTGKTTMVIDQLLRQGYTVYYLNGNNILLSEEDTDNIIQTLDQLKQDILSADKRTKIVLILDECEVAFRDRKKLKKLLKDMRDNKNYSLGATVNHINENTILKEMALTAFMLYMLSLNNLAVICIANTTEISPYMQRRITYLVQTQLDIEEYMDLWKSFLRRAGISFREGDVEDVIYEICKFSVKSKVSMRTIKQFASFFRNQEVSLQQLFIYCKRIEE